MKKGWLKFVEGAKFYQIMISNLYWLKAFSFKSQEKQPSYFDNQKLSSIGHLSNYYSSSLNYVL